MVLSRPFVFGVAVFLFILLGTGGHMHRDKIQTAYNKQRDVWLTARRSRFKRVVSFGDSLSDAGCASNPRSAPSASALTS